MRKILSVLLSLFLLMGSAAAEMKFPFVQDSYSIIGRAALVWELTEEDQKVIENYPEPIADVLKLKLFPDEYGNSYFSIVVPVLNLENDYFWFLIDETGTLAGNLEYNFSQCSCGECSWYDVGVHLTSNWITGGEFYLIFVER